MREWEARRNLELSTPLTVGDRILFVVSEILSFCNEKGTLLAIVASPAALIVFEESRLYARPLEDGSEVTLEELILREPSLREKLSSQTQPS
jgi:hypothetical protein